MWIEELEEAMIVFDELETKQIMKDSRDGILYQAMKKCECTPFNAPCYYHRIAYSVIDGMEDMILSWNEWSKQTQESMDKIIDICQPSTKGIDIDAPLFESNYPNDGITYCK